MAKILVLEDDLDIRHIVAGALEKAGYQVVTAENLQEAQALFTKEAPDLAVVDLLLPDGHGFDFARYIRRFSDQVGIIILTAISEEADLVAALEIGADDYIVKPFRTRELVARVRAVLRRLAPDPSPDVSPRPGLRLDATRHVLHLDGKEIHLTAMQFGLLAALAERPGVTLSRRELLERVWGPDFYGDERTVDVHIRHIRAKLEALGREDLIETVRGAGYRLGV
ncbi:MAG: response regulator transcription factor [Clostridiales bacterium]|nr:response regulator transcription factor [Clostridiales bacterium]